MRADLPTGTVTFLFTDIAGSTRLLRALGSEGYADALAAHRRVVRDAVAAHGGVEVDTQGDGFFVAFREPESALAAAAAIAETLEPGPVRVRAGVHTGTPFRTDEGYVGDDVHLAARVAAAGHGGQVVVTGATAALVGRGDPRIPALVELGEHRLRDIEGVVALFQLGSGSFPPLETLSSTNLPLPASSFVGRERELRDLRARLEEGARILTLTGPGGSGKTRLALEAARSLVPEYDAGVFWVELAAVHDPALVQGTIAQALGARNGLVEHIGKRELLVVLDNFEQVVAAAPDLGALLSHCPNLVLVVTSREVLRVQGEVELAVPPLTERDAVALFCARARLEPSDTIEELCAGLDSLPLAVELAAARTRALSPAQILERLSQRLDLLRGGRDAAPRQQTLRATIEWSYDLLSRDEQHLFARLSVFAGGCSLDAAEQVTDADLDMLQSLVEKSLVRFVDERYRMLETIREFAAERLAATDRDAVARRHRAYVVSLAEASAPELHTAAEAAVSARLAPDYANVRLAVAHALATGEPDDAGRILGALYPFLISHGSLAEAREWVDGTLEASDRLSSRGLAETLVAGGEIARFAGDLDRAIELKERLASADGDLHRPNWKAATFADLSEIALDRGELGRARSYADRAVAAGAGARVELCFAELALREADLRSAESHGLAALAGLEEGSFNHACGLEILGEIARRAGNGVRAGELFSNGLRSFVELADGGGMADCLEGLARVAVDSGDLDRGGRLLGAAERLRDERGRRAARADVPPPDAPPGERGEGRAMALDDVIAYALG